MCLIWTRTYTLCGCTHEITTTHCPPEEQSKCQGRQLIFLKNDSITCKECWRRGDKRMLISEDGDDEHEAVEYTDILTPASTDESKSESESESETADELFIDACEYADECSSPGPESRPATPFLNLRHPKWLDIVDAIDVGSVCQPVERVDPHYRARTGSGGRDLIHVSLGECSVFGFVDKDLGSKGNPGEASANEDSEGSAIY